MRKAPRDAARHRLVLGPGVRMAFLLPIVCFSVPAEAQRVVGINCMVNGRYQWYEGRSTCPAAPAAPSAAPGYGGAPGLDAWGQLGWAIGAGLFSSGPRRDPEAERLEMERRRQEAVRRAEEEQRRRDQLHQRLASALRLSGAGDLNVRFDGERSGLGLRFGESSPGLAVRMGEPELRPQGTSFFGLGGGPRVELPPELDDTRVVDLRHLGRSVAFLKSAASARDIDQDLAVSEALNIANGDTSFDNALPPDEAVPVVSEAGLLAFQRANIDYANSRDWLLHRTRLINEAVEQKRIADDLVSARRNDVDQALRNAADASMLEQRRRLLVVALARVKERDEALQRAKELYQRAESQASLARGNVVGVLRNLAAGNEPAAPPASEAAWFAYQSRMLQERKEIERRHARVYHEIASINVPPPETYTPHQEILILGMSSDYAEAARLRATQVSPLSLRPFTTVVSFGKPGASFSEELGRAHRDHDTRGEFSLSLPQAEPAIAALRGKYAERAFVHSNGASVAEALLNRDVFRAKELHIIGGDRSLANGPALQTLVDSGRVDKVVVWAIDKDPVPIGTVLPEQKGLSSLIQDLAKRAVNATTGIDATPGVEYRILRALVEDDRSLPILDRILQFHDVQKAYFPAMAAASNVPWVPNMRAPVR
jgi:hypothetical protein